MTHDSDMRHPDSDTAHRVAAWSLLGFALLVAAVTFLLSFAGLTDYGHRVARLGALSPLVPLGIDGLTLVAVAATFLLRHAPWRPRAYAWLVFVIANGASIAGNLSHAAARQLPADGMVGAAAWPVLLALASHLAIVTRRALDRHVAQPQQGHDGATSDVVSPAVSQPAGDTSTCDTAGSDAATPPPPVASPVAPTPTPTPKRQRRPVRHATPVGDNDITRMAARRRVAQGESCGAVAKDLGVARKTVERWTRDIRDSRATPDNDRDNDTEGAGNSNADLVS